MESEVYWRLPSFQCLDVDGVDESKTILQWRWYYIDGDTPTGWALLLINDGFQYSLSKEHSLSEGPNEIKDIPDIKYKVPTTESLKYEQVSLRSPSTLVNHY